eukprot:15331538-Ditylum_brightwellii.AAC.1
MDRPHNATELHMFIGRVKYYQDMWPSRAHILKPLTDMSCLSKKHHWIGLQLVTLHSVKCIIS